MKIIMNGNHAEKLTAALAEVQKGCRARTLSSSDIEDILSAATGNLGISQKALAGTELHYSGAEYFPNAYKYIPESTHFTAEHDGRHWKITDISRSPCPNRRSNIDLRLSDSAKEALIASRERFCI